MEAPYEDLLSQSRGMVGREGLRGRRAGAGGHDEPTRDVRGGDGGGKMSRLLEISARRSLPYALLPPEYRAT